jgi:hypothetical protein
MRVSSPAAASVTCENARKGPRGAWCYRTVRRALDSLLYVQGVQAPTGAVEHRDRREWSFGAEAALVGSITPDPWKRPLARPEVLLNSQADPDLRS